MKKHLVFCILFFSANVFAQEPVLTDSLSASGMDSSMYKRGKQLKRVGAIINVSGGVVFLIGSLMTIIPGVSGGDINPVGPLLMGVGGIAWVIGLVKYHNGKKMMKDSKIKMSFFRYDLPPSPGVTKSIASAGITIKL